MSGEADAVIATWVTATDCGARYETLHADGQVHVDVQPPIGEPEFDGQDDPDHNPVCNCPGHHAPGATAAPVFCDSEPGPFAIEVGP
ncbi:hypothetical protein [Streptomyces sp. NPDC000133]|uniref:hypothetical protein n=1 Tax=Streptomyces sp. NPDC000133 TaxID=3364535 RepID=UPI00368EE772